MVSFNTDFSVSRPENHEKNYVATFCVFCKYGVFQRRNLRPVDEKKYSYITWKRLWKYCSNNAREWWSLLNEIHT